NQRRLVLENHRRSQDRSAPRAGRPLEAGERADPPSAISPSGGGRRGDSHKDSSAEASAGDPPERARGIGRRAAASRVFRGERRGIARRRKQARQSRGGAASGGNFRAARRATGR